MGQVSQTIISTQIISGKLYMFSLLSITPMFSNKLIHPLRYVLTLFSNNFLVCFHVLIDIISFVSPISKDEKQYKKKNANETEK
jgi:hypothetical protein